MADFLVIPHPRHRILVRRGYETRARKMGLMGEKVSATATVSGGRADHPVIDLDGGEQVVARRYMRGGLLRHLNRARYFLPNRAIEELRITASAGASGVRVPLVIAAMEKRGILGYTATLLTRFLPDTQELASWLPEADEAERVRAMKAAGEQIAKMHTAGIAHPDLNLRNFLVSNGDAGKVWIIDFDRAVLVSGSVGERRRARDLRRLGRSIRKIGVRIGPSGVAALRDGYGPEWPLPSSLG
jgi:3-deoxy-D-manno-octulosonic acid kinase